MYQFLPLTEKCKHYCSIPKGYVSNGIIRYIHHHVSLNHHEPSGRSATVLILKSWYRGIVRYFIRQAYTFTERISVGGFDSRSEVKGQHLE